jgi:hypothetical protein
VSTDNPYEPSSPGAEPPPPSGFPEPGSGPAFPDYQTGPGPGSGSGYGPDGVPTPYGPYGPMPDLGGRMPRGRFGGRRRGCFGCGCLPLLGIIVLVVIAIYIVPNPWALHIGGRFTPLETWQGYGTVQASNGGHYVLYLNLRGGVANNGEGGHLSCSGRGCDSLFGTGKLCTESGQTYTFEVNGAVHSWWSTDGAVTSVDLTNSPPLPDGWVVALHGAWHGPALQLSSPDNSFTEVFTPHGAIRSVTSTADAGTAQTTVRYGTDGDFTAACRRLAG